MVYGRETISYGALLIELPAEINRDGLAAHTARFDIAAILVEASRHTATTPKVKAIGLNWRDELAALSGGTQQLR